MALASLTELKSYLDITKTTADPVLTIMLDSASTYVERYTGRVFTLDPDPASGSDVTKTAPTHGRDMVVVPDARVITSMDLDGISLSLEDVEMWGRPVTWMRLPSLPTSRQSSVDITGKFGHDPTPAGIKDAVLVIAARAYRERDSSFGDAVQSPDGGIVSYYRQLPARVQGILGEYKRIDL